MKLLQWTLAVLFTLVVIVVAGGYALPVKHHASASTVIPASPGQVYELLTDVGRYPEWRTGVTRVEIVPSPGPHARFREEQGGDVILYAIEDAVPDRRLVTRIADPDLPFGGTWTYTLRPTTGGTELRIDENGEVYNPVFRFVSRFFIGHTATIEAYLHDVARRFRGR